jgi:sister-chromatid-cohesion protein PDS5
VCRKTYEKAIKIVQIGTPRQAKFAARFIAFGKHKDQASDLVEVIYIYTAEVSANVVQAVLDGLSEKKEERLLSYLRALSELAISAKDAYEDRSEEITRLINQEVLFKKSPSAEVGSFPHLFCDDADL